MLHKRKIMITMMKLKTNILLNLQSVRIQEKPTNHPLKTMQQGSSLIIITTMELMYTHQNFKLQNIQVLDQENLARLLQTRILVTGMKMGKKTTIMMMEKKKKFG